MTESIADVKAVDSVGCMRCQKVIFRQDLAIAFFNSQQYLLNFD